MNVPANAGDGGLTLRRKSRVEPSDVEALVAAVAAGTPRAVGRAISVVENGGDVATELVGALMVRAGETHVVGVTGPPGVGKSTAMSALVAAYRSRGRRVAVLAVDPSSPFNRGALLGDRIRMREHVLDPDVFIRSMSTRGHLGGLALAAPQALRVFDAGGFDVVLLETVGVGQSEVEVAELADTTVLVLGPETGDDVQAAKAGIMEIGDIFAVNKADLAGADRTVRNITHALHLRRKASGGATGWNRPVVRVVASTGDVHELVEALDDHWAWLHLDSELSRGRVRRLTAELEAAVMARVLHALRGLGAGQGTEDVAARIEHRDLDYACGVDELYSQAMTSETTGRGDRRSATGPPPTALSRRGVDYRSERTMSDQQIRIILSTDDLDASIKFYTATLGFSVRFRDGTHYAALDGGSVSLALATAIDHPFPGKVAIGIKTDDVDGTSQAIEARGGVVVKAPYDDAHERRAVAYDDQGNGLIIYSSLPRQLGESS